MAFQNDRLVFGTLRESKGEYAIRVSRDLDTCAAYVELIRVPGYDDRVSASVTIGPQQREIKIDTGVAGVFPPGFNFEHGLQKGTMLPIAVESNTPVYWTLKMDRSNDMRFEPAFELVRVKT